MERSEILEKVNEIAKDVFDNDEVVLHENTVARDIEEWDSLSHLALVGDIEDEFDIKFTLEEVSSSKNVGEFLNIIERHLANKK